MRHFLDLSQCDTPTLRRILDVSADRKAARRGAPMGEADADAPLKGRMLAMIFEKPSTRTRVSFDMAMRQLGGQTMFLASSDMQTDRGETVGDTARVLSRYVDAIMFRTFGEDRLNELVSHASVPVINGLTDRSHPCQIMADMMTIEEKLGDIKGKKIAWFGDYNNVTRSFVQASKKFGFEFIAAVPPNLHLKADMDAHITADPIMAAHEADVIVTDTWVSMGQEGKDIEMFWPYQVNTDLMKQAKSHAVFMHCMPIHQGEEVTDEVLRSDACIIYDEAENRLHAQKAILSWCLKDAGVKVRNAV